MYVLQSLVPSHGFRPPLKYRSTPPNFILKITPSHTGWQNMLKPHSEWIICPCLCGQRWDRYHTMYLGSYTCIWKHQISNNQITTAVKSPVITLQKNSIRPLFTSWEEPQQSCLYFLNNFKLTSLWMYYASLMVQVHPILHQTESPIPLFPQSVLVLSFLLIFLSGVVLLFA